MEAFLLFWKDLLKHLSQLEQEVIILGDFNIHMDNLTNNNTIQVTNLGNKYGFRQVVSLPTRISAGKNTLLIFSGLT